MPDGWKISQMPVSTSRKRTSVPNGLPPPKVARVADTAPSETQQNNRRRAEMPASTERAVADSRREREPPVVTSPFYCSFCVQSFCTETTYVRHGKSQKHKDHVKLRAKFRSVELHLEKHAIVSISPLLWMCMLCRCGIDGELAVARHVGSVKHVELMKRGIPSHIKADVERRLKAAALDNNIRSTVQQGRRYAAMSNKVAINDRPMLNDRATMNETMNESASTPAVIEIDGAVESTAEEEDSVKDVLDISTDVSGVDVVSEQSCVSTLRGLNYCSLPADETLNYIKKRDRTMRKQFMCMICNKPLEHMGIQIHLKSKRHRQEEQELKVFQEESKMKIMRPIGRELRCEICNLSYFSVVRYLEHLRQMLHANRVRAICSVDHALDGEGVKGHWSCARCFFFCFDIMSYDAHCRGHIHRKYVSAREKHNNVMLQNGNGGNGPDGSFRNITKLEWEDIWREAAEKEKKRKLKRRAKKRKWKARQKGPGAKEGSSNSGMKQNA